MPSRNTIEIILQGVDNVSDVVRNAVGNVSGSLDSLGRSITGIGAQMTAITAPLSAGLGLAVRESMAFEESITNVGAVLGLTQDAMSELSDELLSVGANAVAGPQAIAQAYYDIAGGVADASTHMAILEAAIATSEAGAASLTGTTSGLISVMNSYAFAADKASFVSDVLTRTVGVGVGTMDEFVASLGPISGTANRMSVDFNELGASMAYLTTQGFSTAMAGTRIQSAMIALMRPTSRMQEVFDQLGWESGQLAVEQYGLAGVFNRVQEALNGDMEAMADAMGGIEALQAAAVLGGEGFQSFFDNFQNGLEGATDAARQIQMESTAYQFGLLKSSVTAIAIEIGNALLPQINELIRMAQPLIGRILDWISANSEIVASIGLVVGGLTILGPILMGVGAAISSISTLMAIATGPIGIVTAAVIGLATIFGIDLRKSLESAWWVISNFFYQLRTFGFEEAVRGIFGTGSLGETVQSSLEGALTIYGMDRGRAQEIVARLSPIGEAIIAFKDSVISAFRSLIQYGQRFVKPVQNLFEGIWTFIGRLLGSADSSTIIEIGRALLSLTSPIGMIMTLLRQVGIDIDLGDIFLSLVNGASAFLDTLNRGGNIIEAFSNGFSRFVDDLLNALGVSQEFRDGVSNAFTTASEWIQQALGAIGNFITTEVVPAVQRFGAFLQMLWELVRPSLESLWNWFTQDALPAIISFIETSVMPGITNLGKLLTGLWELVRPSLETLYEWFISDGLPLIQNAIQNIMDNFITPLGNIIRNIWTRVQPHLQRLFDWFVEDGLPEMGRIINNILKTYILPFINTLSNIWDTVSDALGNLLRWFDTDGIPFIESAITNLKDYALMPLINTLLNIWNSVQPALIAFRDGISSIFNWIRTNVIQPFVNTIGGIGAAIDGLLGRSVTRTPMTGLQTSTFSSVSPTVNWVSGVGGRTIADRDFGGYGSANTPYLIGRGAQPELFVPNSAGRFYPNADSMGGTKFEMNGDIIINGNNGQITPQDVEEALVRAIERAQ